MKAKAEPLRYELGRPVGHDASLEAIENSVLAAAGDRSLPLSHALVIAGPPGVGKFLAALWLGSRLKCAAPTTCMGECPSCKKIKVGTHPDVYIVDPPKSDRSIGIKEWIREGLLRRMAMRASEPGPLVAIVRDAHKLTLEAQSALLKTLEEPSGSAFIVLVTDNLTALLATVRSRCQILRLPRLGETTVEQLLRDRGIDENLARNAARLSYGSPGRALAMQAEQIAEREELLIDFERYRTGRTDMEALLKRLADRKSVDKPGLDALFEWQMKKVEASLGVTHSEEDEKLNALLIRLQAERNEHERLLRDAGSMHDTISAMARNANARLAIRDMLMSIRTV